MPNPNRARQLDGLDFHYEIELSHLANLEDSISLKIAVDSITSQLPFTHKDTQATRVTSDCCKAALKNTELNRIFALKEEHGTQH